ncbi:porphobilinogen synthase [Anaerospora hongkongensis]|uniref:Delta-aminolevulinic acid dehydratase n=1 Tax=Anaerospora hongkongensis TaxID=244830 RepID=A0A4R1PP35_9FIRM|nr:porphobilinogen synthase [Anaerospora hongkongensis]TCL32161.1 porphobilinogen synthase [Anaerospora hongkongensis]
MTNPFIRPRRLRSSAGIRAMVRETQLTAADFVYPLFIVPGQKVKKEISTLPGNYHLSPDMAVSMAAEVYALGIPAVEVFGLPEYKDEQGSSAWDMSSPVQQAVQLIKAALPELVIITDVCLCQYTSTGHCGLVKGQTVDNDPSLKLLARVALSHAEAGADMVAPSDMMDGRVLAIREALDQHDFSHVSIMSYAAKYASAYYGPFREAVNSAPQFGDRKTYQMDPANSREALREVELDIAEGADIIMVKPALAYLDIIRQVKDNFTLPVAAYNVSGEYAMIKAAAEKGWIDEKRTVLETLLSMKRAGTDIIITYHAMDAARWLGEDGRR